MKLLFIAIFISLANFSNAQLFEGEVTYQNVYKSKLPSVSDERMKNMFGSTINWFVKDGSYKSETNGTFALWQLYVNQENKLYSKTSAAEAVLYNDVSVYDSEITNIELHPKATNILGYECDELTWKTKAGVQKYYFSKKLKVNSKLFASHKYGDWYAYLSKSNAVPLKMIVETSQMIMESTATNVKPMKLESSFFKLAPNTPVIKNPY